ASSGHAHASTAAPLMPAPPVASSAVPPKPRPAQAAARPLLYQPRVQRIAYPVLVGVVLLVLWQGLVTGLELPPYLVPSPLLMMQTLVTDWATLGGSLFVTVKITLLAFVAATVAGVLISFLFVQSKAIE